MSKLTWTILSKLSWIGKLSIHYWSYGQLWVATDNTPTVTQYRIHKTHPESKGWTRLASAMGFVLLVIFR